MHIFHPKLNVFKIRFLIFWEIYMKKLISSNVDFSIFLLVYASHCFYESSFINKNERINLKYIFFSRTLFNLSGY